MQLQEVQEFDDVVQEINENQEKMGNVILDNAYISTKMTPLAVVFHAIDVQGLVENLVGQEDTTKNMNFVLPHSMTEEV